MKYFFYAFIAASLLCACKSNQKASTKDSTAAIAKGLSTENQTTNLAAKFKPIIDGVWVKADYIDGLKAGKTPYQIHKTLSDVVAMEIATPNNADSILIGYSLNNHEGAEFMLYFKQGHQPDQLKTALKNYDSEYNPTKYYELGYQTSARDTNILIYQYNKDGKLLKAIKYYRVALKSQATHDDAGWGISYITQKLLFSGSYSVTDSTGANFTASFEDSGKLTGFPNYQTYYPATDFEAGPDNDQDQMYFNIETKQQDEMLYKLNADTINFYSIALSSDSSRLQFGKLRYKLVRQHPTQPTR